MISIIMNAYEIDGKSIVISASVDRSFFGIERVSEVADAEMRSESLKTVESEVIRVSEMGLNGRNDVFEFEEVEARVSEVKDEGLGFNGGSGDNDGGNGGMVGSDEIRVSSELGCGEIERKPETRVSFGGGNDGPETGCDEIKRKIEVRESGLKDEGLDFFSGGNGNFDGGNDGKESRVSFGGRESDMEVVEGQMGCALNSAYTELHDGSSAETSESLDAGKGLSYGFEVGDMVWGKVKSHPWWPGHIYNEVFASSSVRRMRRGGLVLVAFFGDSSYGWFDPAELIPFEPNYAEKSQQTNSRTFMKAVEEAVDEASRRSALGLVCRCRNPFNFRPASVQGYFAVDVVDYEPGGVYSGKQIEKARDSFQPAVAVSFVQQLALMPFDGDHRSIDWIKNVAAVIAYRKAVFEEFDETYAQAFGMEPVRPPRNAFGVLEQPDRVPPRAPLSGPLVIAEALGERRNSGKSLKSKGSPKKDKYLFKRRDEPNEKRVAKQEPHHASQLHANAVPSLAFKESSGNLPSGDYVLQKRAPAVPEKNPIPAKQEQREIVSKEYGAPVTKLDSIGSRGWTVLPTALPVDFPVSQPPAYGLGLSMQGGSEGKLPIGSVAKELEASMEMTERMKLDETAQTTSIMTNLRKSESLGTVDGVGREVRQEVESVFVENNREQDQVMENSNIGSLSVSADSQLPGKVLGTPCRDVVVGKTTKALKRPIGEDLSLEKYVVREKKKRKKDSGPETSLDHQQKRPKIVKDAEVLRKLAGKSIGIGLVSQERLLMDSERKDGVSSGSATSFSKPDTVNVEVELPKVVNDLLALALDPFHAIERNSPAIVRQVFLKFRSLVYQKSLVLPPASESETSELGVVKSVGRSLRESSTENAEIASTVEGREAPASKSLKHSSGLGDPTKMGRKRGPSDRQEEMSAKRLKKLNKLKLLAMEKKAGSQKTLDGQKQGDQKETGTTAPVKPSKTDPVKKPVPARVSTPTQLVMKFPPKTTLPSAPELKARFARFGPLDLSGMRIYWKSSMCRVVFKYKSDAQLAYNYAIGNNSLFGQVKVRYSLRELVLPASELPEADKRRVDDSPNDATTPARPSSSDFVGELRPLVHQQRQPAIQLKSCLKKPSGDEAVPAASVPKESPRVKFLLGGEDSRGEQMVVSSSNNGSSADGPSSSSSMAFDVNIKNINTTVIPPLPPLPLPTRNPDFSSAPFLPFGHQPSHTPDGLLPMPPRPLFSHAPELHESRSPFNKAPHQAHHPRYNEVEERKESVVVDISHQMLSLLMRCSDIVTDIKSTLGYVPYHPL